MFISNVLVQLYEEVGFNLSWTTNGGHCSTAAHLTILGIVRLTAEKSACNRARLS